MGVLLIALIAVPLIEIALFIQVGGMIGLGTTLLIVLGTAIIGALLLREQGVNTASRAQAALRRGHMPVRELFDGMCLFAAGAFLLTPGFLTDIIGLSLCAPLLRAWLGQRLLRYFEKHGRVDMSVHTGDAPRDVFRDPSFSRGPTSAPGARTGDPSRPRPTETGGPPGPGDVIDADYQDLNDPEEDTTGSAAERPDDTTPPVEESRWGRRP